MKTENDLSHKPVTCNTVKSDLPNVLILGDSISIGYTPFVGKLLESYANVYRPQTNCSSSAIYLEHLDEWLDNKKWDVIHFNCGLHDINKNNNEKINRVGEHRVSLNEYKDNLNQISNIIMNAAKIPIWATTTPVPENSPGRMIGDEVEYNETAERIMNKKSIVINDLYAYILPYTPHFLTAPDNVHYTEAGYEKLGEKVAEFIKAQLT